MSGTPAHTTATIASYLGTQLASSGGAVLHGSGATTVTHIESLDRAGPGSLTFVRSQDFAARWKDCGASAVLAPRGVLTPIPGDQRSIIEVADADLALNCVLDLFAPPRAAPPAGVHATAVVDPSAEIGAGVSVGPYCIIGAGARVDDASVLVARVFLGRGTRVGRGCTLHVNVSVHDRCVIGDGCVLRAGAVIGSDGFGYRPTSDGRGVAHVPHIGNVELGRGVDVGANSCIDRAKWGSTFIGDGTKIDNLVQIGHGVRVGRVVLMAAQVGLAGSCVLEDGVMMGGQSGVADQIRIGRGAKIAAQTGVMKDVPAGESWFGTPGRPAREHFRMMAEQRRAAEVRRKGKTRNDE